MMTPERARAIERLSAIVHDLYQNEVKRQGRTLRHEDDYENLAEETKELDRVFVRWHLSCVEEVIYEEREAAKGLVEAYREVAIKKYIDADPKCRPLGYFAEEVDATVRKILEQKQSLEERSGNTNSD